jgi:PAS domain-containing protein
MLAFLWFEGSPGMKQWDLRGVTLERGASNPGPSFVRPEGTSEMGIEVHGDVADGRAVFDQVPAVLWTTDVDLRFTACLGAGLVALGLWPNQMVGTSLYECFEVDDDDGEAIALHRAALDGEAVAGTLLWGGHLFEVRVGPLCDATGAVIGTVGMGFERSDEPVPALVASASRSIG